MTDTTQVNKAWFTIYRTIKTLLEWILVIRWNYNSNIIKHNNNKTHSWGTQLRQNYCTYDESIAQIRHKFSIDQKELQTVTWYNWMINWRFEWAPRTYKYLFIIIGKMIRTYRAPKLPLLHTSVIERKKKKLRWKFARPYARHFVITEW